MELHIKIIVLGRSEDQSDERTGSTLTEDLKRTNVYFSQKAGF